LFVVKFSLSLTGADDAMRNHRNLQICLHSKLKGSRGKISFESVVLLYRYTLFLRLK
jgi:hypothetical protein